MSQSLYSPGKSSSWTGRKTDHTDYLYQRVEPIDLSIDTLHPGHVVLLGYGVDEGIRRNQGRIGASLGPDAIRDRLGKLAYHHTTSILDGGDIHNSADLEHCQDQLAHAVANICSHQAIPVVLGGGHDIAYGHFKGLAAAHPDARIGIINFDAHLDYREPSPEGTSGTPFYQILNEYDAGYLAIGIQKASNHKRMWDAALDKGARIIPLTKCDRLPSIKEDLEAFISGYDAIYITVDMDGFSSAYSPGVSAPNPIGLTPIFVLETIQHICSLTKVISLDIAETNPTYERDQSTARLAASIVYSFIDHNYLNKL